MSIMDFINYLKSLGISIPIYPLAFPTSSPERSCILEIGQGVSSRGSVYDMVLTITVKAEHPKEAESLSQEIIDKLHNKTNQVIGDNQVILIKSQQLIPNYLGKDAEGNHYCMNSFRVLVND